MRSSGQRDQVTKEEKLELAQYLVGRTEKYPGNEVDLTKFYGIAHFDEDTMDMQRRWRTEWD